MLGVDREDEKVPESIEAIANPMRAVLALALLIALCASADAATLRRFGHLHTRLDRRTDPNSRQCARMCLCTEILKIFCAVVGSNILAMDA